MSTIQSRTPEKNTKKNVTSTWKFPWKSCSTTHLPFLSSNSKILKAFLTTFPIKMKPTKCPAKEKMVREKQKKRKREKAKSESQDCWITFKAKNYLTILLSVYAWTLQANILHLNHKATKCTTCKWLYASPKILIPTDNNFLFPCSKIRGNHL